MTQAIAHESRNMAIVKTLTYLMFAMFAMTTDSVGLIIPEIIKAFQLSLTAAGTFQYATMAGIAFAGLVLGQLADRFGRRRTIVAGLTLFAAACFLLSAGQSFLFFAVMLGLSGLAIGVFKTGALALIGDISTSTAQHTSIMNTAEGFFGVGAIIGPAILARLLTAGLSWTWLYAIAGTICLALIVLALVVQYPETTRLSGDSGFNGTGRAMRSPYVLAFSAGAFLYVGVEAAVYVWMPTYLQGYAGPWGHQGHAEFSYDFEMPVGSPVVASRSGEVVFLVEHHKDGTRKPGEENVVVIKHADGSFARYYHLTTDGVLMAVDVIEIADRHGVPVQQVAERAELQAF